MHSTVQNERKITSLRHSNETKKVSFLLPTEKGDTQRMSTDQRHRCNHRLHRAAAGQSRVLAVAGGCACHRGGTPRTGTGTCTAAAKGHRLAHHGLRVAGAQVRQDLGYGEALASEGSLAKAGHTGVAGQARCGGRPAQQHAQAQLTKQATTICN